MKILLDSDVLLDVLADRQPFVAPSSAAWALAEPKRYEAVISALSFTNIYYVGRKLFGHAKAMEAMQSLSSIFEIAPVDRHVIDSAISSGLPDFEDAVQAFAAASAGATHVVTRDARGFVGGPLAMVPPDQLPALLAGG